MAQRVQQIASHLAGNNVAVARVGKKTPDDVVIVTAVRTPMTKSKKGGFKDTVPEDLLAAVFKAILEKSKIDPNLIQDIAVGNVLPPGGGATVARAAALYAGIPDTAALNTINRQCSSGLQAVVQIAHEIALDQIEVGIGAGVESMTYGYGAGVMPENTSEKVFSNQAAADCLLPMGITSENVAKDFGVTRAKQDAFAASSHKKAAAAQDAGLFKEEIIPVITKWTDPKTGDEKEIVVSEDDGIRRGTTPEGLAKLKPAFAADGTTTAGTSSQVSDGAGAVLLMKRKTAERLGLPILGKFVRAAVVGVPPRVMGIGPAYAIPIVLKQTGLSVDDIDIYEINEAFASQAVYCVEKLGIDINKVNPKGGAIALGHPLGATGARQISTLFTELRRTNKKIGLTSMCIGSGMGMAAVFEAE
ncbi:3105_t:CDS:2 [Funneliformis geosporum]|uniref:acetyl-CoA C-acyltransferase n=1 Tax=Funneliformis geosporum TaxID=1117311 RepID=A0A9W4SLN8_9GLOM|nr:3105_t:CDS:2 [Funneliformis geosporum]CAI2173862.1 19711_t:CDS:2 [Funneliformis geosporum]